MGKMILNIIYFVKKMSAHFQFLLPPIAFIATVSLPILIKTSFLYFQSFLFRLLLQGTHSYKKAPMWHIFEDKNLRMGRFCPECTCILRNKVHDSTCMLSWIKIVILYIIFLNVNLCTHWFSTLVPAPSWK